MMQVTFYQISQTLQQQNELIFRFVSGNPIRKISCSLFFQIYLNLTMNLPAFALAMLEIKGEIWDNKNIQAKLGDKMDTLTGFITKDGNFRIVVAQTKGLVNRLKEIHHFSYPVTNAVSRFVTGAALLSSDLKGKDVIGVYLNCSGPLGGIRAEANALGQLKAFALNPRSGVDEIDSSYVMPLSQLIGQGTITVSRTMEGGRFPFSGTVEIEGERLAIGFSRYLMDSMQVNSAVLISNFLTSEGQVEVCAGMLVQALPGVSPEDLEKMENEIEGFPPFSEVIRQMDSAEQMIQILFSSFRPYRIFHRPVGFHCSCSEEKVIRVLNSLSAKDLEDSRQEDGLFHVNCDYCGTEYVVRPDELSQ